MTAVPLPVFDSSLRDRCAEAALLAARYIQANQVWHVWPYWTADAGRIPHNVSIRDAGHRPTLTLTWDCARSAQALLAVYGVRREDWILEAARRALEYAKVNQIFSPEFPQHRGAFCEEVPQSNHIAARDVIEAVQGFLHYHAVTGDVSALQRAEAGADWLAGHYMNGGGWPYLCVFHREKDRLLLCNDFTRIIMAAVALPFAQLDVLRGRPHYASKIPMAMDWLTATAFEADGSLRIHDGAKAGHHAAPTGPLAHCFVNDDGAGVALLAAHRATGNEGYRATALRYGEWWLRAEVFPETYAAIPCAMNFFLDMARFTGDRRYVDKCVVYAERLLPWQHLAPGDPRVHGGFRGHDGEKDIVPIEFISLRTTMYAMMALSKMAARTEAEWPMCYSAFGW